MKSAYTVDPVLGDLHCDYENNNTWKYEECSTAYTNLGNSYMLMCTWLLSYKHTKKVFSTLTLCAIMLQIERKGEILMKHVKTLNTRKLQNTIKKGGCGECQTSCQSACKTSCTVGNQTCEQYK